MAAALCVGALAAAGCGGDDETQAPQSTFTIKRAPTTTSSTTSQPTTTTTTTEDDGGVEPGDDDGGQSDGSDDSGSPSSGSGGGGTAEPDTPSNDVTPPANTPQGQFEMYCNQNPGACG